MKNTSDPDPHKAAAQGEAASINPHSDSLAQWLTSPAALQFFGKSWALKADVLAALLTGGNLAAVARKHGVTRAATSKQLCRARAIFANLELTKGDLHD